MPLDCAKKALRADADGLRVIVADGTRIWRGASGREYVALVRDFSPASLAADKPTVAIAVGSGSFGVPAVKAVAAFAVCASDEDRARWIAKARKADADGLRIIITDGSPTAILADLRSAA